MKLNLQQIGLLLLLAGAPLLFGESPSSNNVNQGGLLSYYQRLFARHDIRRHLDLAERMGSAFPGGISPSALRDIS
jgi:hypothetical protein